MAYVEGHHVHLCSTFLGGYTQTLSRVWEMVWEDFYDVYERMTYVYTFEKPKVWIF